MATARKTSASNETRKRAPSKETAARKAPAKKATTKKTAARKAPAKKTTAKKTQASRTSEVPRESSPESKPAKRGSSAMKVARAAAAQLAELTGRQPESVIGIERTDEGWEVDLEVVESRRIPDSTDILATYRVQLDDDGELMGYYRVRRYVRGKGIEGDGR